MATIDRILKKMADSPGKHPEQQGKSEGLSGEAGLKSNREVEA